MDLFEAMLLNPKAWAQAFYDHDDFVGGHEDNYSSIRIYAYINTILEVVSLP